MQSSYDNVFVMYHRKNDDYPLMVKPQSWTTLQNSGEIADGVVIVDGGKVFVVAPTENTLPWSSASVSGDGVTTTDRMMAMNDWEGKANTASQIKHPECQGVNYAPGFCAAYSRTNANGYGLTAGKWWLPSLGELMMLYANMRKINYALSLITGAIQLSERWYWSSTDYNTDKAWVLYFSTGLLTVDNKTLSKGNVRPISQFIQ